MAQQNVYQVLRSLRNAVREGNAANDSPRCRTCGKPTKGLVFAGSREASALCVCDPGTTRFERVRFERLASDSRRRDGEEDGS